MLDIGSVTPICSTSRIAAASNLHPTSIRCRCRKIRIKGNNSHNEWRGGVAAVPKRPGMSSPGAATRKWLWRRYAPNEPTIRTPLTSVASASACFFARLACTYPAW